MDPAAEWEGAGKAAELLARYLWVETVREISLMRAVACLSFVIPTSLPIRSADLLLATEIVRQRLTPLLRRSQQLRQSVSRMLRSRLRSSPQADRKLP